MANYFSTSKHSRFLADVVLYHPRINEITRLAERLVRRHVEQYFTIPEYDPDADLADPQFAEAMVYAIAELSKRIANTWDRDETLESWSVGPRSQDFRDNNGTSDVYRLIRTYDVTPVPRHL